MLLGEKGQSIELGCRSGARFIAEDHACVGLVEPYICEWAASKGVTGDSLKAVDRDNLVFKKDALATEW